MSCLTDRIRTAVKEHPCAVSFAVSFLMLLSYSLIQGIYPAGNATFLRKDLYHQYLPFLYELRRRLLSGASLGYSFELGLGASFYA
ncbi:MAG: YfhO family protein, partial [Lachnospiraceae bacterium]|nr:YfhO family protein [Lachnospiraceae bacterium]